MLKELQKLNEKNFSSDFNKKEKKFTINLQGLTKPNYCVTLIAHNEDNAIIEDNKTFKKGKVRFEKVNLPILYLIYPTEALTDETNHLNQEIYKLREDMRSMKTQHNTEFYNSTLKEVLTKMVSNLNNYFKDKNTEIFIGLLTPYNAFIDFSALPQNLDAKNKALTKLNNYHTNLIEIRKKLNIFINYFIAPGKKLQHEKFLQETDDFIDNLADLIVKREENFLANPIISIDKKKLKEIDKTYKTIENSYSKENGILQNYTQILSNRNSSVSEAIKQLDLFKESLQEPIFADEIVVNYYPPKGGSFVNA